MWESNSVLFLGSADFNRIWFPSVNVLAPILSHHHSADFPTRWWIEIPLFAVHGHFLSPAVRFFSSHTYSSWTEWVWWAGMVRSHETSGNLWKHINPAGTYGLLVCTWEFLQSCSLSSLLHFKLNCCKHWQSYADFKYT